MTNGLNGCGTVSLGVSMTHRVRLVISGGVVCPQWGWHVPCGCVCGLTWCVSGLSMCGMDSVGVA